MGLSGWVRAVGMAVALVLPVTAAAQEEDFIPWTPPPAEERPSAPTPPSPPPPPPSAPPAAREPLPAPSPSPRVEARRGPRQPKPEDFNRVSLFGAPTLGTGKGALGVYLGFPLVGVRGAFGVAEGVDLGLGFDSFYGVMNDLRATARVRLLGDAQRGLSFQVQGGHAWFVQRPETEERGARWLTGRRNWNLEPGLVASWRGDTVQSARLFVDLRWHVAFDTEPFSERPLGGVPPSVVVGHNVPFRMGAELPFTPKTSFLFMAGFDIHGREIDAAFMPTVSVGLVSGL